MSNFYMENWDLQAVVGESSNEYACISDMENPVFSFDPWSFQQDEDLMSFPEVFETNPKVLDELGELYKPFYPELNPYSTQTIITSSLPVLQDHVEEPANQQKQQQPDSQSAISDTNKDSAKPKRSSRKNRQNRVVQHVTADDLPSDKWSWRKYGQKPIKGSPYPRSYYRCSSSKGCLARKQVERSSSDPRMFVITYTAEHSHGGHPTRRNSLAGCTRNKSSTVPKSLANKNYPHEAEESETVVSPTANSKVPIKDESVSMKQESIKMEELQQMLEDVDQIQVQEDKILSPNIMLSDDLVQSLENFEGLFLDQFPDLSHELWSMNESATLTGGVLN